MTWHQSILPRRVALASALAAASTTATRAEVAGIVLALAIIPLGVVVDSIASLTSFKIWTLFDMGEDILTAIVWRDEAKALFLEELLDCPSRRHGDEPLSRYQGLTGG